MKIKEMILEKSNRLSIQFVRYAFVGLFATMFDMSSFYFVNSILGYNYIIAQSAGFILGISINYILSIIWVFNSSGNIKKEVFLFAIIGIVGLFLSYGLLWLLIDIAGLSYFQNMLAKSLTVIIVLFWNFFARKKFIFSN